MKYVIGLGVICVMLGSACSSDTLDPEPGIGQGSPSGLDKPVSTGSTSMGTGADTGTGASGVVTELGAGGGSTGSGAGSGEGGVANSGGGELGVGGDPAVPEAGGGSTGSGGGEVFVPDNQSAAEDYTETVAGESFDMIYVPGGTFTLGCENDACPQDTEPVENITVSSYHIAKNQVTAELYNAVMGDSGSGLELMISWYDANAFACELSELTGKAYRMMTEAEYEYAAKNYESSLADLGSGEEWAFNSWETSYSASPGDVDPLGPSPGQRTQKTRRDVDGHSITGRLIRSIDGIGPQLRLVVSNEIDYPPGYVPTCEIRFVSRKGQLENSYRDPRWITGDDAHWTTGSTGIGNFDLQVWEDGTASYGSTAGQWFTSNNFAFVFVPSSGSSIKLAYIFLDETQGSIITDEGFMSGGFIGRYEKAEGGDPKPSVSGLQSGADLAAVAGEDYKMVDMENIPESAKEQDERLVDGPGQGWFQNNINAGGTHNYRMDVDADEFRFVAIDEGSSTMLANGAWFTINNTFLRVTHPDGYTADYLYAVDLDGILYQNSFQEYERCDFRMFEIYSNSTGDFPPTCISNSCSPEIEKGQGASTYATSDGGESTFTPAPCPAGGCH